METLDQIKSRIGVAVPGVAAEIVPNDSPSAQRSLLVDGAHAPALATFLRDDPELPIAG